MEEIIKIYNQEMVWDGENWTAVAQDRSKWQAVVNTVMNIQLVYAFLVILTMKNVHFLVFTELCA
jgi:sensor domain CHASE-containing protein